MNTLQQQVRDYVHAGFSGIWIVTSENDECERSLQTLTSEHKWPLACWDIARGIRSNGKSLPGTDGNPLAALSVLRSLKGDKPALLVLHNFHRHLGGAELAQATLNLLNDGKSERMFVIVLAPDTQGLPKELEKRFVVINHPLPNRDELATIMQDLGSQVAYTVAESADLLDAAAGLTHFEAEGAFALSLAKCSRLNPKIVWDVKAQTLKKNKLLTLHQGKETFADLGGLGGLKTFLSRAMSKRHSEIAKPRGVLLLGVPGAGKSAIAKALGNEIGRPTLTLDVGALYGSLVGQTEANVRQALAIADAMQPCILFIDEIEKALAGVGGQGDSGVATRLFGTLLTWLSDHESDVFTIATANDVHAIQQPSSGAFARAERWDGIFFVDFPDTEERYQIWKQYASVYGFNKLPEIALSANWTGAEIKSCCRLAALLGISFTEAAEHIVPVASTASESVRALREWANGRCLSATTGKVYSGGDCAKRRRTIENN